MGKKRKRLSFEEMVSVYLLRCDDGSLYCGIARDVQARIRRHEAGRGARYVRGRGPLSLLTSIACGSRAEALRLERRVKRLTRAEKLRLVDPARFEALRRAITKP